MVYILNRKYKGPLAPLLDRHWNKYHLCVWLPGTHESTFVILSAFQILWNYPYLTIIIVFFWYTQMINMFRATNELPWYRTASRSPEPLLFIQEKGQKSPHKKSITQLDYLYFNIQRKENYCIAICHLDVMLTPTQSSDGCSGQTGEECRKLNALGWTAHTGHLNEIWKSL